MTSDGPAAEELTEAQVQAIQTASDEARGRWAEIVARDPSVKAAMTGEHAEERAGCLALVRDAYRAAGVSEGRARQASESWLIAQRGVRGDLALGDERLEERRRRGPRRGPGVLGKPPD